MRNERLFSFVGGELGEWRVTRAMNIVGEPLPPVPCLSVCPGPVMPSERGWVLAGVTSNIRYATRVERDILVSKSPPLGRAEARMAALIPIRKTPEWWALPQDDRRAILAENSRHITIGLEYIPAIARSLYHARDLGEPFDFLTWFEFAPEHEAAFDDLVHRLRATEEWTYVDREYDIRLESMRL